MEEIRLVDSVYYIVTINILNYIYMRNCILSGSISLQLHFSIILILNNIVNLFIISL